jgi:hypothetical protein
MRFTRLRLGAQRRQVVALAALTEANRREADARARLTLWAIEQRVSRPSSLGLAFLAGMALGAVAPSQDPNQAGQRTRPKGMAQRVRGNLAARGLVRAARAYLASRVAESMTR